jgi:CheY-like chemotaxis protein
MLKEMLEVKVDKAMNGKEAVILFKKNIYKECCNYRYKLVFMDLNMPVMDGYEATTDIIDLQK